MPRLPSVGSREVVKAFRSFGWQVARQSGSYSRPRDTLRPLSAFWSDGCILAAMATSGARMALRPWSRHGRAGIGAKCALLQTFGS